MTPRAVSVLFICAVASVAAAVYGVTSRAGFQETDFQGQRVFPTLLDDAKGVTQVTVTQSGNVMTFVLDDSQWRLSESDGYAVHNNLVSKAMFGLANMEYLDAKTRLPARHGALDLGPPEDKASKSQRAQLKNAAGDIVADLVVGRANYFLPETTTGGMYVRKPGDDQTWLARGLVDLGVEPRDWLQREIIDFPPEQVKRVDVRHPDGERLAVVPLEGVTGGFAFENMPDDLELTSEFAPRNIAALMLNFVLNDVRKDSSVSLSEQDAFIGDFQTDADINVTLSFWQKDAVQYLRVGAVYVGDDSASDAAKRADAINARTAGWTYIIPEYQYEQISKKLADVTKKKAQGS